MCRETVVRWSCGHHIRTFKACREAVPRSGKKPSVGGEKERVLYKEAVMPPNTVRAGNATFWPCKNDFQSHTSVDPPQIPFCYRKCVPDYWTCCKCQIVTPFGTQSRKENGKRHISSSGRLRRLAPAFTVANGSDVLQTTDVCSELQDEEYDFVDVGSDGSDDNSTLSWEEILSGCQSGDDDKEEEDGNNHDDNTPEASLSELHNILAEMDDTVSPLPGDMPTRPDAGCGHMRCKKCVIWRRCLCKCMCPHLIPATRHHCSVCVQSGCNAIKRNNLKAYIRAKIHAEWKQ
ncbi:hypothetical protein Sste5346_009780 [Sporothrix stenoceras]|uniref:Uncharacterized protein n=1 Tax=Sporothrix stenoceras TaxID=5173 RepID=A0ABR3YIT4_9PEZI